MKAYVLLTLIISMLFNLHLTAQNIATCGAGCHIIPAKKATVKENVSTPKKITSALGASCLGILSGIVMIGALPLVKHTDALGSPLSYALLASALLYSTYDITRRSFGPEYASIACWNSLASMVAGATILLARE
jgi:hypothetical protein